jgi:hypothetical protein
VPTKRITEATKRRVVELLGLGLSWNEACRACDISKSTLAEMQKHEHWRKAIEDAKADKQSLAAQTANVVQELLTATDKDGNPDIHLRKLGAEMYAKNPALIDAATVDPNEDSLLPGCRRVIVFPRPPDMP